MNKIKDFIYRLSQALPMSCSEGIGFYYYVRNQFDVYIRQLNSLDEKEFRLFLNNTNELSGNATANRFINLIKDIQKNCLSILILAYKGDMFSATKSLDRLLTIQEVTKYRLNDMLVNYFVLRRELGKTFYRCVDFGEGETPNDCWHLPFNLKYKAARGRFNQLGTICMYVCNSKECANRESGPVKEQSVRWVGEFKLKQGICLYNLVVPSKEYIENMSIYEQFCLLLTYPFYILCLTKNNHPNGRFCEEYLFSQLFFHMLFLQSNDKCPRFDGICYTSMQTPSAVNIVIPAKYEKEEPPMSGHSQYVKSLLQEVRKPYQYSKDY